MAPQSMATTQPLGDADTAGGAQAPSRARVAAAFAIVYWFSGSTFLATRFAVQTIPPVVFSIKMRLRDKVDRCQQKPNHGGRYGQCNTNPNCIGAEEEGSAGR